MDEPAIIPEPIRKRARIGNKCEVIIDGPTSASSAKISFLPVEIIFEILSYLSWKDLYAVSKVSKFFERLAYDPSLWRAYEVTNDDRITSVIIKDLKRMPLLRKFVITERPDCDDILRQISLTNKNLEELYVSNCTGTTSKLYLRSSHLIRILERCPCLHTINVVGSRFRGQKFYRLLGEAGTRLRTVYAPATGSQFRAFVKHARQIGADEREAICAMCAGAKSWSPFYYILTRDSSRPSTALISYLHNDVVPIDVNQTAARKPARVQPRDS